MKCKIRRGCVMFLCTTLFVMVFKLYRSVEKFCDSKATVFASAVACLRPFKLSYSAYVGETNTSLYPQHYTYAIENKNVCADGEVYVIVLVHTSTDHFTQRKFIRNTTFDSEGFSNKTKLVFLIGKPNSRSTQTQIVSENKLFGDIVQGNFLDTYQNLTHKALFGFQWVLDFCKQAKFILKIDDDVIVNMSGVISLLSTKYADVKRTIMCHVKLKGTDPIFRNGKWPVSLREYPMKYWPVTACLGFIMIYTTDIISELYEASSRTPFLWIDDIYVSGYLAAAVGNITHYRSHDILRLVKMTGGH